jgi:hypothetical protein
LGDVGHNERRIHGVTPFAVPAERPMDQPVFGLFCTTEVKLVLEIADYYLEA